MTPLIEVILIELYPYIYLSLIFVIISFLLHLGIFILLFRGPLSFTSFPYTTLFRASVVDHYDGTYTLEWASTRPGTYQSHVLLEGDAVVNSPITIQVCDRHTTTCHRRA